MSDKATIKLATAMLACSALFAGTTVAIVPPAAAADEQVVKISAKKFEFAPNQMTVKKGHPVVLQLTSSDRAHGIAIPALNLRSDIAPGKVTELKFTPQKSGDLKFYCDVFCGDGHDNMEGTIKVVD